LNRPILIIAIGYIIGILWGLYLEISIVFLYLFFLTIFILSKFKKLHHLKIFIKNNVLILIIISSMISNIIINRQNWKYENLYKGITNIELKVQVVGNKKETQYYKKYKVKVLTEKYKNTYLYIMTKNDINYGDILKIKGEYSEPQGVRNYKGFDYKEYLKENKIYGTVKTSKVEKIGEKKDIFFMFNKLYLVIKERIEKTYTEDTVPLVLGLMLGDISEIDEKTRDDFEQSSISHVLAVSGQNVLYIIFIVEVILQNILGQKLSKIAEIVTLIIYMYITGLSVSVVRACIMGIIMCLSFLVYRKNDTLNNIAISCMIILINNPFSLFSASFQFTYAGTIGVIYFEPIVEDYILNFNKSDKYLKIGTKLSFMNFNIITPNMFEIIIYYSFVVLLFCSYKIKEMKDTNFVNKKIKVYFNSIKSKIFSYKRKILICIILIIFIISIIKIIPSDLKIYFVDVGQGDCCFIITPNHKTILIDGGGQENYDIGENTLVPYILDRRTTKIDYCIISHFDSDHVLRDFNSYGRINS